MFVITTKDTEFFFTSLFICFTCMVEIKKMKKKEKYKNTPNSLKFISKYDILPLLSPHKMNFSLWVNVKALAAFSVYFPIGFLLIHYYQKL